MAKLFPEKTMELWTANALIDILGQRTWIWSPEDGADQIAWDHSLRKLFVLELKAPDVDSAASVNWPWAPQPRFQIDLDQLDRYVTGYHAGSHPDVVYVLPAPVWWNIPRSDAGRPLWTHPNARRSFALWTYTLRASELHKLLCSTKTSGKARAYCAPLVAPEFDHWHVGGFVSRRSRTAFHAEDKIAVRLNEFLLDIDNCDEPIGVALRSTPLLRPSTEPTPDERQRDELQLDPPRDRPTQDMELTAESVDRAIRAIAEATSPRTRIAATA